MRFKDYFLLTEDPDDMYGQSNDSRTFGFCGNLVMYFEDNGIATHWDMLCLAKKRIFGVSLTDFCKSPSTIMELRKHDKTYRQTGVASDEVRNYLRNSIAYIGRSSFINNVDGAFLGRISMTSDLISFWNSADSFSPSDKRNVTNIIKIYGKNPKNMTYNFVNEDMPETNMTYEQFHNINQSATPVKQADTSHIVHNLAPDQKKAALLQMGAKPKPAKGVEARYLQGESFKDFIKTISESPDLTVKRFPDQETGSPIGWPESDARTFIVADDFICIAKQHNMFHEKMYEPIREVFNYNNQKAKQQFIMHGIPSVSFLSQVGEGVSRPSLIQKFPNWIQGRIWLEHKYISFWNHGINVRNNLKNIELMIRMLGDDPENFTWEIDNKQVLSFDQLKNIPNIDGELPDSHKDNSWQQQIHTLPPEKKGNALKAMGVKPKAPMGAAKRYAMGESFKDFFLEDAEHIDGVTSDQKKVYASYSNLDARAFVVDGDFNIIAKTEDDYHYNILQAINTDKQKKFSTHGVPSNEFVEYLESTHGTTSRGGVLNKCPNVVLGRLWLVKKCIGFWNRIGHIKNNFSNIIKLFNDNNLNPEEFVWELPDMPKIYTFDEVKQELNIHDSSKDSNKVEDWQTKIHLAPAEIKGNLMKQRGIKPKPSKGVEHRYLRGESFNFKDFFKVISEKNYNYNIPQDKELLLYDFYMLVHLTALEKEGKFEPGDKVDPYGQGVKTTTSPMGVRDSTKHSFEHIKEQVIDHLQPALLEASFYSVSCEFRHLFDNNNMHTIESKLGKDGAKFCSYFKYNLAKLQNKSQVNIDHPEVKQHVDNRRAQFNSKHNIKLKDKHSRNASYTASYKAVKKSISDMNKGKSAYESMTEADFISLAGKSFTQLRWNASYGGEPWASICDAYIKLNHAKKETDKIIYIDNMYHQQHNTDTVFNKISSYCKNNSYSWVLHALNFKADVRDNWDRIKKIRSITAKNGVAPLRDIDKMYVELLKASGDRSYEQYYKVDKKTDDDLPAAKYDKKGNVLPPADLSGLTSDKIPFSEIKPKSMDKMSDDLIHQAITFAKIPFINMGQVTGKPSSFLNSDKKIKSGKLIFVGQGSLIKEASINVGDVYMYNPYNEIWVMNTENRLPSTGQGDYYAISNNYWRKTFGEKAYKEIVPNFVNVHGLDGTFVQSSIKTALYPFDEDTDAGETLKSNLAIHHEPPVLVFIGYGGLLVHAAIKETKDTIYEYNKEGNEWKPLKDVHNISNDSFYAVNRNTWADIFGYRALEQFYQGKKQILKDKYGEIKEDGDVTNDDKEEAMQNAIIPFLSTQEHAVTHALLSNDSHIEKYEYIYIGKGPDAMVDFMTKRNIPIYQHGVIDNKWNLVNNGSLNSFKAFKRFAIKQKDWVDLFGKDSLDKVKQKVKEIKPDTESDKKIDESMFNLAISMAARPFFDSALADLRKDNVIDQTTLFYIGKINTLIDAGIVPPEKVWFFLQGMWYKYVDYHKSGNDYSNHPKAIYKEDWEKIFGKDALEDALQKINEYKNKANNPLASKTEEGTLTKVTDEAVIEFATVRGSRPFKFSKMLTDVKNSAYIQNMTVIYVGTGMDLVKEAKIPKSNLYYFIEDRWTQTLKDDDDMDQVAKAVRDHDWIALFGNDAWFKLKETVKSYKDNYSESDPDKATGYTPAKENIQQAVEMACAPFIHADAWADLLKVDYINNAALIYMGTGHFIRTANGLNIPETESFHGYEIEVEYDVNNTLVKPYTLTAVTLPIKDLGNGKYYAMPTQSWEKVFGKEALDKVLQKFSSYKTSMQKESFKHFFQQMFTESPDKIRDRNDPEKWIRYSSNDESYTVLMYIDGEPGTFAIRKDSAKTDGAGHGNLKGILRRVFHNDLEPEDNINEIKSDIPIDEIALKQNNRGAYEVRIWTHNKIISFWNEWRPYLVPPTLKLFKFLGQKPEEYIFEMDSSYYNSSEADSPACYTYEEFTTGKKDHSPEALVAKQKRLEDRNLLAQAKLGMLKKDPIIGTSKAPSFYRNSGD